MDDVTFETMSKGLKDLFGGDAEPSKPFRLKYLFGDYRNSQSLGITNLLAELLKYEESQQIWNIKTTRDNYSHTTDVYRYLYGESANRTIERVELLRLVHNAILRPYINLPGLEEQFSSSYCEFEWALHNDANFKGTDAESKYYRDHFEHQARNLYMMLLLLLREEYGVQQYCCDLLQKEDAGDIPEYVSKWVNQQVFRVDQVPEILIKAAHLQNMEPEKYIRKYTINYAVTASCVLAALFHDLAYPLCSHLERGAQIRSFTPQMTPFLPHHAHNFNEMYALLKNSLLFLVVSRDELEKSLHYDKDNDFIKQHGAYSAIAFLYSFYQGNALEQLPIEKRLAVELAALAIYDHTMPLAIHGKKAQNFSIAFHINPIAFLLRMCDDLQEWDRKYFEVTRHEEEFICPDCHTPVVALYLPTPHNAHGQQRPPIHVCRCGIEHQRLHNNFIHRSFNLVTTCDKLTFDKVGGKLNVVLHYNPYALLRMACISVGYANYRSGDLKKSKKILNHQQIANDLRSVEVNYFLSANPFLLKAQILREYLEKPRKSLKPYTYRTLIAAFPSRTKGWWRRRLELYYNITRALMDPNALFDPHMHIAAFASGGSKQFRADVLLLLCDAQLQIHAYHNREQYMDRFSSEDSVYIAIERYCQAANWANDATHYMSFTETALDYHSDLRLFELLSKEGPMAPGDIALLC